MVVALDQIRLLCDYAEALLWSHTRRTKPMETETADKYLSIFPFQLLAAVARGDVDLNHWAGGGRCGPRAYLATLIGDA